MILYAICKAKNPSWTDAEIAADCGFNDATVYHWKTKYGSYFSSWLEEMIDCQAPDKEAEMLHAVGMIHALQGSFQHWKEMAKTKGVIKEDQKPLTVNINTDFSHIAIGNFDEERARILSSLRGVGRSSKPGVAGTPAIDITPSNKSEGGGASEVQDGSMALANSLGSDRRR